MEKMRFSMKACCMHPDKEHCKGKIKAAHALQNNKIISRLAGKSRHVYVLDSLSKPILVPLDTGETIPIVNIRKVSANAATTLNCFCDYHDNVAFASIEKGAPNFDNTETMNFTYAYKAFIFEYYKQRTAFDIFKKSFKENPPAFLNKKGVALYRMMQLKMKEFDSVKDYFDKKILSKATDGLYTCAIMIHKSISFADYAYFAPEYDMNGRKIKHTKHGVMHRISLTIFPEENCFWLLLSCLESEKEIYEEFFLQMKNASFDKLKYYINLVLPLYSENIVLSPNLWESWDEETQCAFIFYANLQGKDAMKMGMTVGMALKNAFNDKTGNSYKVLPRIGILV